MSDTTTPEDVIFSDYVSYSPLITWLLLVAPATTLSCVLLVWLDDAQPPAERELSIKILVGTTAGILLLYLFILPIQVSVKSNGSVCIRVLPMTYTFFHAVRAYQSPGMWDDSFRARIKFATNISKRVVILRRNGKWALTVSPLNPKEFVDAVSRVTSALEAHGGVT